MIRSPVVRMFGRAVAAAALVAVTSLHDGADWKAAAVAGGLVLCELFTPLNAAVGLWAKTSDERVKIGVSAK